MAVVLNPATLKFSDAALELEYTTYRSLGALLNAERTFAALNGAMYVLFIAPELLSGRFHIDVAFLLKLLGMLLVVSQYLLTSRLPTATWLKHRVKLVACFRTARLVICLVGMPYWMTGVAIDQGVLIKTAILRTGMAVNLWYALGMPLLFEEHLIVHSFHVIITAAVTSKPTCAIMLGNAASRIWFDRIWNSVDWALMTVAGLSDGQPISDGRWIPSCQRLLLVMHLLFSLALPSLLLWKMEVASRVQYVEEQNRMGRRIELDCSWLPDLGRLVGKDGIRDRTLRDWCSVLYCEYFCLLGIVCWRMREDSE